jgi:glycerol-3-phosphate cytidylyltransferase-like family protein
METIRAKLRAKIKKPFKLVVGVEADTRTEARKGKQNVHSQEERRYMFNSLKAVDHAYIEFE